MELTLEIGGKNAFSKVRFYLFQRPETTAVELVARLHFAIVNSLVCKDEFLLSFRFKNVSGEQFGSEIGDAEFFLHFAFQSHLYAFAQIDVTTYGCIPFARLDVFPVGTFLELDFALAIEYREVHHRVEEFASVVAFATGSCTDDIALFVHNGEHFLVIVLLHKIKIIVVKGVIASLGVRGVKADSLVGVNQSRNIWL